MVTLLLGVLACAGPSPGKDGAPDTATDPSEDSGGETGDSGETGADSGDTAPIDADGDGSPAGEDCDDADASVHPGAEDAPYDGVDADCAGDDDDDADRDGHAASAYGGTDCDDQDPRTFPGAPEWCDPVDHDCDGVALPAGVCSETQDVAWTGAQLSRNHYSKVALVGDVTGDEVGDIVLSNPWLPGAAVWAGGSAAPAVPGVFPDTAHAAWYDSDAYVGAPIEVGDVDGDGWNDLGILFTYFPVGIALFFGPVPTDGRVLDATAPDEWWFSTAPDDDWGTRSAFDDFDGDGLGDAAVAVYDSDAHTGGGHVLYGGVYDGPFARIGDRWDGSGVLFAPGDVDGDGYPDLIASSPDSYEVDERYFWIGGATLAARAHVEVFEDATYAELDATGEIIGHAWTRLPDQDGDGADELALSAETADGDWELLLFPPDVRGTFGLGEAIGGFHREDDSTGFGYSVYPCAAFGAPALVVLDEGPDLGVYPLPGELPARGTPLPTPELRMGGYFATSGCRDVTGDGREDIAFHAGEWGAADEDDGLVVVPGWELPWDDAGIWTGAP